METKSLPFTPFEGRSDILIVGCELDVERILKQLTALRSKQHSDSIIPNRRIMAVFTRDDKPLGIDVHPPTSPQENVTTVLFKGPGKELLVKDGVVDRTLLDELMQAAGVENITLSYPSINSADRLPNSEKRPHLARGGLDKIWLKKRGKHR